MKATLWLVLATIATIAHADSCNDQGHISSLMYGIRQHCAQNTYSRASALAIMRDPLHGCTDTPGFKDAYGTCKTYRDKKWCAKGNGSAWEPAWGPLGAQVKLSCCGCGKQLQPSGADRAAAWPN